MEAVITFQGIAKNRASVPQMARSLSTQDKPKLTEPERIREFFYKKSGPLFCRRETRLFFFGKIGDGKQNDDTNEDGDNNPIDVGRLSDCGSIDIFAAITA